MPISGVVIRCRPDLGRELEQQLHQPGRVEISHVPGDGSLIAVIESTSIEEEVAVVKSIMAMTGVFDVRVAYHNFEDIAGR